MINNMRPVAEPTNNPIADRQAGQENGHHTRFPGPESERGVVPGS